MKYLVNIAFLALFFVFSGCGGSSLDEPQKVAFKDGELIADFPANLIKEDLLKKGLIDKNTTVFGFRAYKLSYTTKDDEGKELNASGVIIVPSDLTLNQEDKAKLEQMKAIGLSIVVDNHGTVFANKEAPSVLIANTMMPEGSGVIYSSLAGFITLQADYIGFGDSKEHYHPYLLKNSSANAVVDFYKKALEFLSENNIAKVNSGIFLSGYSQGGYVTLAALKKFEEEHIAVNIATPMAGPYLLDPIAQSVLSLEEIAIPSFMAAVAHSYATLYKQDITSLIQEPYASKLSRLFDSKEYTREEIDKELTTKVKGENGLFSDEIVQNYQGSWFQNALKANSVVDFAPQTPVKLIQCKGDSVVPYAISEASQNIFANYFDTEVDLIPVEDTLGLANYLDHVACAKYAYMIANNIFVEYRKATIGY
jgi:pimeloyl-ACP methyl ester carboxylesterase